MFRACWHSLCACLLSLLSGVGASYAQGVITTVAGTDWVFPKTSVPALTASLGQVRGIAVDIGGNVFLTDQDNSMVMRISPDGMLTVLAGNGSWGFSGEGGQATSASLSYPAGVAVDVAGKVYFADTSNNRIRKVALSGIITTVAGGNFMPGFSGDGGPAINAALGSPECVAVDAAGNLFIADTMNNRIRKVALDGNITTLAGMGDLAFSGDGGPAAGASLGRPSGVAVDGAGNVYVADTLNNRIRKVTPAGTIQTIAGGGQGNDGGPAVNASLDQPPSVAVDGAGNVYIADRGHSAIRKVTAAGTIRTVAGGLSPFGFAGDGGPATKASLYFPCCVAIDSTGALYIADSDNARIRKVLPSGTIGTIAGNGQRGFAGDGGPAINAFLWQPVGVALDTAGNFYFTDSGNLRVRKVTPAGIISTVAGNGQSGFSGDGGAATAASLNRPAGIAVDFAGNLFIADSGNNRIRKVAPSGAITTVAGAPAIPPGDGGLATSAQLSDPRECR